MHIWGFGNPETLKKMKVLERKKGFFLGLCQGSHN
jgi:hypothetical protein